MLRLRPPAPAVAGGPELVLRALALERGDGDGPRGISVRVGPGALCAVVGPSGAGKTTLVRLLAGLERPTLGSVLVGGADPAAFSARERRALGLVLEGDELAEARSVTATLERRLREATGAASPEGVARLLDRLLLAPQATRPVARLSAGQRRRVAVARALVARPSLVLADDPALGLDPAGAAAVLRVLHDLAREGATVVLTTPDPALAARADRALVLVRGRLVGDLVAPTAAAIEAAVAEATP